MGGAGSSSSGGKQKTATAARDDERSHVFTRIAYLNTIMMFAASELMDAIRLSHINSAFRETLVDYSSSVWQQIAKLVVEQPGFSANFLYSFQAPKFCCNWAIRNVYAAALNPNHCFFSGAKPALFVALKAGNAEVAILLVDAGARSIELGPGCSGAETSPMILAIDSGNVELVKKLAARDLKMEAEKSSTTVRITRSRELEHAMKSGRVEMIQALAVLQARRNEMRNWSHYGNQSGSSDSVVLEQEMIRSGIFYLAENPCCDKAFRSVAELLPTSTLLCRDEASANTLVHVSARPATIQYLVGERKLSVLSGNSKGETPLAYAIALERYDQFHALLPFYDAEAINWRNPITGMTALHHAAASSKMVAELLERGAAPSLAIFDRVPAASLLYEKIASMVPSAKAAASSAPPPSRFGRLPIHIACEKRSTHRHQPEVGAHYLLTAVDEFLRSSAGRGSAGKYTTVAEYAEAETEYGQVTPAMVAAFCKLGIHLTAVLQRGARVTQTLFDIATYDTRITEILRNFECRWVAYFLFLAFHVFTTPC